MSAARKRKLYRAYVAGWLLVTLILQVMEWNGTIH